MTDVDSKIKELYDSRNDIDKRLTVVENNFANIINEQIGIRRDMRSNHVEYIAGIREIQGCVEKFRTEINGLPKQNSKEIDQIKLERCKPMVDKVDGMQKFIWVLLGMGLIISGVLIPIAIQVLPMFFKK